MSGVLIRIGLSGIICAVPLVPSAPDIPLRRKDCKAPLRGMEPQTPGPHTSCGQRVQIPSHSEPDIIGLACWCPPFTASDVLGSLHPTHALVCRGSTCARFLVYDWRPLTATDSFCIMMPPPLDSGPAGTPLRESRIQMEEGRAHPSLSNMAVLSSSNVELVDEARNNLNSAGQGRGESSSGSPTRRGSV